MRVAISLFPAAVICAAGCAPTPEWYPPPPQREDEPAIISMSDRRANRYIVQQIDKADGAAWRWTHERPELQFTIPTAGSWKFAMDFIVNERTFAQTGPIFVSFYINGHLLAKHRFTKPGEQHFEHPVPAEWLKPGEPTLVAAEVDKPYVSPADGAKLGFLLLRAGFFE